MNQSLINRCKGTHNLGNFQINSHIFVFRVGKPIAGDRVTYRWGLAPVIGGGRNLSMGPGPSDRWGLVIDFWGKIWWFRGK